ncbi:MAG: hypothetical protein RIR00_493 [Pseudomonadota bacterium]|jgi:uncharacterized protein
MTAERYTLSEEDLLDLDALLTHPEMEEGTMDIAELDGYLTAIALNPDGLAPEQWLGWVWDSVEGRREPGFEDSRLADLTAVLVQGHFNEILAGMAEGRFESLLRNAALYDPDDAQEWFDPAAWCDGFLFGISHFPKAWQQVEAEHPEWLAPMRLLGTPEGEAQLAASDNAQELQNQACDQLSGCVAALYAHFQPPLHFAFPAQTFRREQAKVGRNDPCACGSGRKYKKCCGKDAR